MNFGFEITSAKPKGQSADAPTQERMTAGTKIRRNPSTDQKKTRRLMQRSASKTARAITCHNCGNTGTVAEEDFRRGYGGLQCTQCGMDVKYDGSQSDPWGDNTASKRTAKVFDNLVPNAWYIADRAGDISGGPAQSRDGLDRMRSLGPEFAKVFQADENGRGDSKGDPKKQVWYASLDSGMAEDSEVLEVEPEDTDVIVAARNAVLRGRTAARKIATTSRKVAWSIEDARRIVTNHQHENVDGTLLDAFSASALVAVFDALSPENQAKFSGLGLSQAVSTAFKLTSKGSLSKAAGIFDLMDDQVEVAKGATGVADLINRVGELWLEDGDTLMGALSDSGWRIVEAEASYHWSMKAPDGSILGYIEGDLRDYTQYGGKLASKKTAGEAYWSQHAKDLWMGQGTFMFDDPMKSTDYAWVGESGSYYGLGATPYYRVLNEVGSVMDQQGGFATVVDAKAAAEYAMRRRAEGDARFSASKKTAGSKSDICPKCGSWMDDVMIYDAGDHEVLEAHCSDCGWDGQKRKPKTAAGAWVPPTESGDQIVWGPDDAGEGWEFAEVAYNGPHMLSVYGEENVGPNGYHWLVEDRNNSDYIGSGMANSKGEAVAAAIARHMEEMGGQMAMFSRKTAGISKSKAETILKRLRESKGYDDGDQYGPTLEQNWDFMGHGNPAAWSIVWEEGPYQWAYSFPHGGVDEEFGFTIKPVEMPGGVHAEPVTSWAVALYDEGTTGSKKTAAGSHYVVQRGGSGGAPTGPFATRLEAEAEAEYMNAYYGFNPGSNYVATVLYGVEYSTSPMARGGSKKTATYEGTNPITREQYETLKPHDYAGKGTPMNPDADGYWAMYYEPGKGTTLITGLTMEGAKKIAGNVKAECRYCGQPVDHFGKVCDDCGGNDPENDANNSRLRDASRTATTNDDPSWDDGSSLDESWVQEDDPDFPPEYECMGCGGTIPAGEYDCPECGRNRHQVSGARVASAGVAFGLPPVFAYTNPQDDDAGLPDEETWLDNEGEWNEALSHEAIKDAGKGSLWDNL